MEILFYPSLESSNTFLKQNKDIAPFCMVVAVSQPAGRGQRGNTWESEPGKNLTFSFYFAPEKLPASRQFTISEAVALSVVDLLRHYGIDALVKWPNDIYAEGKKICGILIENSIYGSSISKCIVGVGLNVNQTQFSSSLPNPVSMSQMTGREYPLEKVALKLGDILEQNLKKIDDENFHRSLHQRYLTELWRGDGDFYPFKDADGNEFKASIHDIEPMGHILLKKENGETSRFAFKEIAFL